MHQCEEFRERITEHIIDREDLAANPEFHHELLVCSACSEFYAESREIIDALSTVDLSIPERQWDGIEHRLRMRIVNEAGPRQHHKATRTPSHTKNGEVAGNQLTILARFTRRRGRCNTV